MGQVREGKRSTNRLVVTKMGRMALMDKKQDIAYEELKGEEHERMIRFVCEDCNYNMLTGIDDSGTGFYCPTCDSILDEQMIDDDDEM
jgi:Zn finger protein HypA/HybF involved in hydrogenase expression